VYSENIEELRSTRMTTLERAIRISEARDSVRALGETIYCMRSLNIRRRYIDELKQKMTSSIQDYCPHEFDTDLKCPICGYKLGSISLSENNNFPD
jgi:hypothetical protein